MPYPYRVMSGRGIPHVVPAVNGTSWSSLQPTQTTRLGRAIAPYERCVLVMCGGTSDLTEGDTAATLLSDMEGYATSARALGVDYIIATTITPSTLLDATQETRRVAANTLIKASTAWEACIDLAAIPALQNTADTTYYLDGTHWTGTGAQIAADAISPAVDTALN